MSAGRRRPSQGRSQSGSQSGSRSRGRSQRRSRYRLKYPGRLFGFILLIVIVIGIVVALRYSQKPSSEDSGTSVQTITGEKEVETGTVRPVSSITIDSVGQQLSSYMASMIYANPTNYKRTSSEPNTETPETETVDLTPYRYVVAINANAGGSNSGWVEEDAIEKDITLNVARAMVEYMNNNSKGFYFLLVRDADSTMTDSARLTRISKYDADMVVTLCCNGSDQELGGVVATYYEEPTQFDAEGEPIAHSLRDQISAQLAQAMMESCAQGFDMWFREIEVEESPLLQLDVPAIKVYMGFLTYYLDNELAQDEAAQTAAAEAMGQTLIKFCEVYAPEKTRGQLAGEALTGGADSGAESSEGSLQNIDLSSSGSDTEQGEGQDEETDSDAYDDYPDETQTEDWTETETETETETGDQTGTDTGTE